MFVIKDMRTGQYWEGGFYSNPLTILGRAKIYSTEGRAAAVCKDIFKHYKDKYIVRIVPVEVREVPNG